MINSMMTPRSILTTILLTINASPSLFVSSEWEYIPPEFACSPTLSNCNPATHSCLANPNHPQSTTDEKCTLCQSSQTYWPCDVDGLCYCWDISTAKIPPAPSTRLYNGGEGLNVSAVNPCDILTLDVFHALAPEAQFPYSYEGFCTAVSAYNANHPKEGVFNMGSIAQQTSELAAFFGNALHESDEFRAGREYLMCADRQTVGGEVYCKPCDSGSFDWDAMTCPDGASLASEGRPFNSYCQSNLAPPEGCECDDVYERMERGPMAGYVKADQVYFGRGSIQLSWNYNYIRASVALTGAAQTFCQRPDLVATNEEYAWGAGLFYWMENVKNDKTCHQSVLLNGEFGETLDNINGGLECPADDHGWHGKAVILRINRYCRAATALGSEKLLSLEGCLDMEKRMRQCLSEGTCRDCNDWEDSFNALPIEEDVADTVEQGGDDSDSGGGGKKDKDKNKDKQNNDDGSTGGPRGKSAKADELAKQEQEDAAAKEAEQQKESNDPCVMNPQHKKCKSKVAETPNPTPQPRPPTLQPTASTMMPTYTPIDVVSLPANNDNDAGSNHHRGACTGFPCSVPTEILESTGGAEFCRSADGICGMGVFYCNVYSTWISSCTEAGHVVTTGEVMVTGSKISAGSRPVANKSSVSDGNRPQSQYLRTRRPTSLPTPEPSLPPTPNPTKGNSSAASQFDTLPATTPIAKPTVSGEPASQHAQSNSTPSASQFGIISSSPAKQSTETAMSQPAAKLSKPNTKPATTAASQSSAANAFAMTTHSKGRNNPISDNQATTVVRQPDDDDTPSLDGESASSSANSFASQFGSDGSSVAVTVTPPPTVVSSDAPSSSPTPPPDTRSPTSFPTEQPAKKMESSSSSSMAAVDESEEYVDHSMIMGTLSENNEDELPSDNGSPDEAAQFSLPAVSSFDSSNSQGGQEATIPTTQQSYYTQLSNNSYLFTPMDDVTISRSSPTSNYGAYPSLLIDMLEGDAALLRFDLSVIGDGIIDEAVLQLTPHHVVNDGEESGDHGGVYYIQPTVNGWTEGSVTYDTAPKANGALFASVATEKNEHASVSSTSKSSEKKFELDVTKAVANHVISFRVVGTDRQRKEFSSKESSTSGLEVEGENGPILLVTLQSTEVQAESSVVVAESTLEETTLHSKGGLGDKDKQPTTATAAQANNDPDESSSNGVVPDATQTSTSGSISGHIWNDKNGNAIQDAIEPGIRGILVDLYNCNADTWLEGTRTAAGGDYIFDELEDGMWYYVVVTVNSDYGFVSKNAGGVEDGIRDSGVDPSTGRGDCIELSSSGGQSSTVNAGIAKKTLSSTAAVEVSTTPADGLAVVSESEEEEEDSSNYNCRGRPCTEGEGYCRSKYNFCGIGPEYCNVDSQWIPDCPTLSPTTPPSAAPTTPAPTFILLDVNCSGGPCDEEGDGKWCRSEIGYCGSGTLYCNSDSTWMPACSGDGASDDNSNAADITITSSNSLSQIQLNFFTAAPTKPLPTDSPSLSLSPTKSPSKDLAGYSPFARPTLSTIVTPKQSDIKSIGISKTMHGNGDDAAAKVGEDDLSSQDESSVQTDASSEEDEGNIESQMSMQQQGDANADKSWYTRYSGLEPISRKNAGKMSFRPRRFNSSVCLVILLPFLFY